MKWFKGGAILQILNLPWALWKWIEWRYLFDLTLTAMASWVEVEFLIRSYLAVAVLTILVAGCDAWLIIIESRVARVSPAEAHVVSYQYLQNSKIHWNAPSHSQFTAGGLESVNVGHPLTCKVLRGIQFILATLACSSFLLSALPR